MRIRFIPNAASRAYRQRSAGYAHFAAGVVGGAVGVTLANNLHRPELERAAGHVDALAGRPPGEFDLKGNRVG